MRPVCHPVDGVQRAASEIKKMLYDRGLDPDAKYPCLIMAPPPLDEMPSHRMIHLTVIIPETMA